MMLPQLRCAPAFAQHSTSYPSSQGMDDDQNEQNYYRSVTALTGRPYTELLQGTGTGLCNARVPAPPHEAIKY